jgi:tetratricopeptide (TPR) repeat protein
MRAKRVIVIISIITLCFAMVAIVVLPLKYPTLYSTYGNALLKCNLIRPAIVLFEKHVTQIENNYNSGEKETASEYLLVITNMRLSILYAECLLDYNRAIDIAYKINVSYPEECEFWNCGFELSYYYFKKGDMDKSYDILKETKMGKNVNSIDEMIVKYQSYDNLRSKRPNKCR